MFVEVRTTAVGPSACTRQRGYCNVALCRAPLTRLLTAIEIDFNAYSAQGCRGALKSYPQFRISIHRPSRRVFRVSGRGRKCFNVTSCTYLPAPGGWHATRCRDATQPQQYGAQCAEGRVVRFFIPRALFSEYGAVTAECGMPSKTIVERVR